MNILVILSIIINVIIVTGLCWSAYRSSVTQNYEYIAENYPIGVLEWLINNGILRNQYHAYIPDIDFSYKKQINKSEEEIKYLEKLVREKYEFIRTNYKEGLIRFHSTTKEDIYYHSYIARNEAKIKAKQAQFEQQKRQQQIDNKYKLLKQKYPKGLPEFEKRKRSNALTKEEIIKCEQEIKKIESDLKRTEEYTMWEKEQEAFSQQCRNHKKDIIANWGCYRYYPCFFKTDKYGNRTQGQYELWQFFNSGTCLDDDLDYSYHQYIVDRRNELKKFQARTLTWKNSVYDRIISFVSKTAENEEIFVFIKNTPKWDSVSLYCHYIYLIEQLEAYNIPYFAYDLEAILSQTGDEIESIQDKCLNQFSGRRILIIDFLTENDDMLNFCSSFLKRYESKKFLLSYISLIKLYSREEMQKLISKKKEKIKIIEEQIDIANNLLRQKKIESASKQLKKIKSLENDFIPEFHEQFSRLKSNLETLQIEEDKKIDSLIDTIKENFDEDPCQLNNSKAAELLKDEELPKKIKDKIKLQLKTLEDEYKQGIIPEQQKNWVKYNIAQCPRNGYYAFYTAPMPKTEIIPYRRRKVELRGYTEESFETQLRRSLKDSTRYKVLGDVSILTSENNHPYEPDIAIVEISNNYGLRIDIEIDEPYGGFDKTPIHYIGCGDNFRDCNLANLGWLVVRFSEKQIYQEPDNCIFYLHHLISLIDPDFSISSLGSKPSQDKCWSEVEAQIMAIQSFREQLLNHEFGQKEKTGRAITTKLTDLEKEAVANAKPISIPTEVPHNIDKTDTTFSQDTKLSFDPTEHIYLYDGHVQFTAVSNIINKFFTPFDSIRHSERVARRHGISQCKVLEEWDCKGLESREVGTFLHSQIEAFFSNLPMSMTTQFQYNGIFIKENKDVSIDQEISYFKNFLKDNPIVPFRTEWHIFDLEMGIAGTIDLLCRNGNHFDIYDWKRSRRASPNETVWRNGINGLESVPDISFYHYALQQNLYKYILEKNYGVTIDNMYIVVLHQMFGNYQKYTIPNMSREISIIKSQISV